MINSRHVTKGHVYEASSINHIKSLLKEKESELELVKKSFPELLKSLSFLAHEEVNYLARESDFDFGEDLRKEFVRNNIEIHQLTNEPAMAFDTKVMEILKPQFWQLRYISPKLLDMKYEMAVYNNIFSMYYFDHTDFFGVEIYNEKLAIIQRQIYDFMWESAQPMKYFAKEKQARIS